MDSYQTIDGLMEHMRESGIDIDGEEDAQHLLTTGYYHGYKGYRFFGVSSRRIPFSSYEELKATIEYDDEIKDLLIGKIRYIERSVRNITLACILEYTGSNSISSMLEKAVRSYHSKPDPGTAKNARESERIKRGFQKEKLNLERIINQRIERAYGANPPNPIIAHYFQNHNDESVPLWAAFEVLCMGDLGKLLSCLETDLREKISRKIGLNLSVDTNRGLVYKFIYLLKDLRNAIAHDLVVFDARFRTFKPDNAMKACLTLEFGLRDMNFDTIGDYVILICYYLKILGYNKQKIVAFINDFEMITRNYAESVSPSVSETVIHQYLYQRLFKVKSCF